MKSFSLWAAGMVALAGVTGCSAAIDATETDAEQADGDGCGRVSDEALMEIDWVESDQPSSIRVSNLRDVDAVLVLTATVVADGEPESTEFARVIAPAGESMIVPVPGRELVAGANHGSLHVTARAEFVDGKRGWDTARGAVIDGETLSLSTAVVSKPDALPPITTRALTTTTLCFRHLANHAAGYGEDYFAQGVPTYRPARGMVIYIEAPGYIQYFYMGNDGCSGPISVPLGTVEVHAGSTGVVDGTTLEVVDDAQDGEVQYHGFTRTITSASTQTFDFNPTNYDGEHAFNVYAAASWVLDRLPNQGNLTIKVNNATSNSNYWANVIKLEVGVHQSKWVVGHEMGHWALDMMTDFPEADACALDGNDGHSPLGREYQQCAFNEGFANHWSALAFNFVHESDCAYGSNDCDRGVSSNWDCKKKPLSPNKIMERCFASSPWSGWGNETDWSRVLWNMRAPDTGLSTPDVLDWIDDANNSTAWTSTNVYALLNARANTIGGTLNTKFDAFKGAHGINHP